MVHQQRRTGEASAFFSTKVLKNIGSLCPPPSYCWGSKQEIIYSTELVVFSPGPHAVHALFETPLAPSPFHIPCRRIGRSNSQCPLTVSAFIFLLIFCSLGSGRYSPLQHFFPLSFFAQFSVLVNSCAARMLA